MYSDRSKAIIAAYQRGWKLSQIAFATGISRQRVQQVIRVEERRLGVKINRQKEPPKLLSRNH
jgi:hypothetical protein